MPFGPKANGPIDCIIAAVSCALEARGADDVNPVAAASKVTADSLANTRISNSLSKTDLAQARISVTTRPATSVNLKSRPL
jgi:hypothetical protein